MHRLLPVLSAACLTACWDLPPGDKTSPDFWADLMLDKYGDELVVADLEAGPAPIAEPRTVLLITGVTIRSVWFDPIVARLERDGFAPVVYEPPALLSGSLFQAAEDLALVVERVRAASGQDKIDILAECTGGVIARHYIQSLGGDAKVSRLVTFVSPQNGIAKAPLAAAIAGWPALHDLSPGSEFLRAVNGRPLPANVPVTSIYTCNDEYIQPYDTSIIPGATNIGLCGGFVGHFQTFYDPAIYRVMFDALTKPLPGSPSDEPAPEAPPTEPAPEAPPTQPDPETPSIQPDLEVSPTQPEPAMALAPRPEIDTLGCAGAQGSNPAFLACALLFGLVVAARSRRADRR